MQYSLPSKKLPQTTQTSGIKPFIKLFYFIEILNKYILTFLKNVNINYNFF